MKVRNAFRTLGVYVTAGALALSATPAATAGTTGLATRTSTGSVAQHTGARNDVSAAGSCREGRIFPTAGGGFVSAELEYTGRYSGMLRARAEIEGKWEQFRLCRVEDNGEYYDTIYSLAAQRYVSTELDYPGADQGMLRARQSGVGQWEKFWFDCQGKYATLCTIKSLANNKYVSAELAYTGSGYGMLRARASSAGNWEWFVRPE